MRDHLTSSLLINELIHVSGCRSLDGQYCIGSEPTVVSTSVNVVAIVVPIIIVAVVLVLIGETTIFTYKCDSFRK